MHFKYNKFVRTKMRLNEDLSDLSDLSDSVRFIRFVRFAGLPDLSDLPDLPDLSDLPELSNLLISGFQKKSVTDGRNDKTTDKPSYRDAWTHLKT